MDQLPQPRGQYKIGFFDGLLPGKNTRAISYRCYYPAEEAVGEPAPYFTLAQLAMYDALPFYDVLKEISLSFVRLRTNAYRDVPFAKAAAPAKILLYSHGYAGYNFMNSIQHEALASLGYVVFALAHPGESIFCQAESELIGVDRNLFDRFGQDSAQYVRKIGKTDISLWTDEEVEAHLKNVPHISQSLAAWTGDISVLINHLDCFQAGDTPLHGMLDCSRVGVYGYSFGGAAAFSAALKNPRIQAAVNLDGWQYGGEMLR